MKPLRILVIDDEPVICDACHLVLTEKGYTVEICMTGTAGLMAIEQGAFDVLLLDIKLPDLDGLEILKTLTKQRPGLCVIVMTGYDRIPIAVEALKRGAADYLGKPFTDDELIIAIEKACVDQ